VYVSEVSVREAAQRLAVHPSRVRSLVSAGQLDGRRIGSQWVVELEDLERRQALVGAGATSRAMSARSVWGAAALLDGQMAPWLASSERSRLRARLRAHDGANWQTYARWLTSRQRTVTRYRVADTDLDVLLATGGVVATGVSAAHAYHLGLGTSGQGDAYVTSSLADQLVQNFFLIKSAQGNLTLRIVDGNWHLTTARHLAGLAVAARLMVAADLLDTGDSRSLTAGTGLLGDILDGLTIPRSIRTGQQRGK
jgi:excisionase family DNA binding protein